MRLLLRSAASSRMMIKAPQTPPPIASPRRHLRLATPQYFVRHSARAMEDILDFPPVNMGVPGTRTESQQPPVAASEDAEQKRSQQVVAKPQLIPPAVARDNDAEARPPRRRKSKTSAPQATEHALLSRTAAAVVDREFEALSRVVSGSWNARLDAMAREMMRPMLRVWLDRHLPKLVRQLVREEIARISGTSR